MVLLWRVCCLGTGEPELAGICRALRFLIKRPGTTFLEAIKISSCKHLPIRRSILPMATAEPIDSTQSSEEYSCIPQRRFKTSELPLTPLQRSTIDGLLNTIKKKGDYDTLRKKVWSQYAESVCASFSTLGPRSIANTEIANGVEGNRMIKCCSLVL